MSRRATAISRARTEAAGDGVRQEAGSRRVGTSTAVEPDSGGDRVDDLIVEKAVIVPMPTPRLCAGSGSTYLHSLFLPDRLFFSGVDRREGGGWATMSAVRERARPYVGATFLSAPAHHPLQRPAFGGGSWRATCPKESVATPDAIRWSTAAFRRAAIWPLVRRYPNWRAVSAMSSSREAP